MKPCPLCQGANLDRKADLFVCWDCRQVFRCEAPKATCRIRSQLTEEDIRRECESKGVPVVEHPGTAYHLCYCGCFHLNEGYEHVRTPLGWAACKINLGG